MLVLALTHPSLHQLLSCYSDKISELIEEFILAYGFRGLVIILVGTTWYDGRNRKLDDHMSRSKKLVCLGWGDVGGVGW